MSHASDMEDKFDQTLNDLLVIADSLAVIVRVNLGLHNPSKNLDSPETGKTQEGLLPLLDAKIERLKFLNSLLNNELLALDHFFAEKPPIDKP